MKPLGKEHNRRALRSLHDQGIEMTPDELLSERKAAYANIRREMRAKGFTVPDDDVNLFLLIQQSQSGRKKP